MEPDYFRHYKLEIDFIDDEHLKLIKISDDIKKTIKDKIKTMQLVNDFYEFMKLHFKHEEDYMEEIKYPYIFYHKKMHNDILVSLTKIIEDESSYDTIKQSYFLSTLRKCLMSHIDEQDRQISVFLKLTSS